MSRLAGRLSLPFSSIFFVLVMLVALGVSLKQTAYRPAATTPSLTQQHEALHLAESLAQHQNQLLGQTSQLLRILSGISFAGDNENVVCDAFLSRQLENFPDYDNLAILNQDGSMRCHARFLPEPLAMRLTPGAHGNFVFERTGDYLQLVSTPTEINQQHGRPTLAVLPISTFFRVKGLHVPSGTDMILVGPDGKGIFAGTAGTSSAAHNPALLKQLLTLPADKMFSLSMPDGELRLYSHQLLPGAGASFSLIVGMPISERTASAEQYLTSPLILIVGGVAGMAILLYFLLRLAKVIQTRTQGILSGIASWLRKWLGSKSSPAAGEESATELRRDHEALKQAFSKHEERVRQISYLDQFSQFLHSCSKSGEVAGVVAQFAQEMFPQSTGALLLRTSAEFFEPAAIWGGSAQMEAFQPDDCWALRLGKIYHVHHPAAGACCAHLKHAPAEYVCIPLSAHGEMLGVLHLSGHGSRRSEQASHTSNIAPWAATALAERTAMALSAIRREEVLRTQATRDALTGLYNRRFMEESLNIEERRAVRRGTSIGLMLLDVDHFKRFNDTFGHDAGDTLLRGIGALLRDRVREGDMPCRLGGEEFVIVLPGVDVQDTWQRAESLRLAVAQLAPEQDGQPLGTVTVSIGVACFPQHGDTWQAVLKAADLALYEGKRNGRNRVLTAK